MSNVAYVNAVHLKQKQECCFRRGPKISLSYCFRNLFYLQDHVPGQQAAIPSDDTLPVDVLDQDTNQRSLVSTNDADCQRV